MPITPNNLTNSKFIPLISLRTNLKNLKFGSDQPGGGNSNQPFIKTQIPQDFSTSSDITIPLAMPSNLVGPIFRPTSTGGVDYPMRGSMPGATVMLGGESYSVSNHLDYKRIKAFLESKPRGSAFIQKQRGLQLSNPKTETGNSLFGQFDNKILPGLIENTRLYNDGRNTLEQIKNQGNGIHIVRAGATPYNYLEKYYSDVVGAQNVNNEYETNRLIILQKLKMVSEDARFNLGTAAPELLNLNLTNRLGISYDTNLLFQYLGGPGSSYGQGLTLIRRTDNTTNTSNPEVRLASITTMTYDQILMKSQVQKGQTTYVSDFRTQVQDPTKVKGNKWDFQTDSLETKFYIKAGTYVDKMNLALPIIFKDTNDPFSASEKDIIKFGFECMDNDNPGESIALFFRAFLNGGITDNHAAELNGFKYMGRGETFYTYQGFNRSMNFSFRMVVGASNELEPLYIKLNRLVSQVYPDYSTDNYMRAPMVKLTIGDYVSRMPGFLESVNITIDGTSSWEIDTNRQLPHVVDVSISFKPIYDSLPKRSTIKQATPIIGSKNFYNQSNYKVDSTNIVDRTSADDIINFPLGINPTNRNDVNSNQA
jgi:hypothetical protein